MPPVNSKLHIDRLLSNISIKYRNPDYIAMQLLPEVPVIKESDVYRIYDRHFKLPQTLRAVGAVAREASFDVSTATYSLERHSLVDYVADRQAENFDGDDLRAATTEFLTDKILLRLEKSVLDLFTSTNWSQGVSLAAGGTFSDNTTTSNPIPIFDTGTTTLIANSGQKPSYALMGRTGFVAVKNHTSVIDRIKYTSMDVNEAKIASLLGVPKLLVSTQHLDTAAEGIAASLSPLFSDKMFLGYVPAAASVMAPSAGYIFRNKLPLTKRWRDEPREADAIEVNMEYQAKVVASLCGYFINNTE